MNQPDAVPPPLEKRFLQPEGWRWHSFANARGKMLRFGTVAPPSRIPGAIVIGLQGLSEFTEKYYEIAHAMVDRNLSFWMLDWQGHGKSGRYLKNPHRRHASSFDDDVADLHSFIMEYVKHSAVHPDVGRIPMVMLAHSMGGNIGLHYLRAHPDMFACAAFSAPMIGINAFRNLPAWLSHLVLRSFREVMNYQYIPGGSDWRADMRGEYAKNILSGDPARNAVHNAWCQNDPALQVGSVTYGWVHEALASCRRLQQPGFAESLMTPSLLAIAGRDKLVDDDAIRRFAAAMPHAQVLELPESHHEILMERDDVRNAFLAAFDELLTVNNIKEKLKPF